MSAFRTVPSKAAVPVTAHPGHGTALSPMSVKSQNFPADLPLPEQEQTASWRLPRQHDARKTSMALKRSPMDWAEHHACT
jgi:hypothetical protein